MSRYSATQLFELVSKKNYFTDTYFEKKKIVEKNCKYVLKISIFFVLVAADIRNFHLKSYFFSNEWICNDWKNSSNPLLRDMRFRITDSQCGKRLIWSRKKEKIREINFFSKNVGLTEKLSIKMMIVLLTTFPHCAYIM